MASSPNGGDYDNDDTASYSSGGVNANEIQGRKVISGSQLRSRAAKNISRRVSTLSLMGDELSADELENNRFTSEDEDGDYKEDSGDGDFNLDESEDTQEDDIEDELGVELDDESQEDETEESDDEVDYPKPKRLKSSKSFGKSHV